MLGIVTGWIPTAVALAVIAAVFIAGYVHLGRELSYVRVLADQLAADLALASATGEPARSATAPTPTILGQGVRDEIEGVRKATDPTWAFRHVRGWQMRAQRLEPALAFWIDLLRQLGLLGTVLGLGLSLLGGGGDVRRLLAPLGLAVWTTVVGLTLSLVLSAKYAMSIGVWADHCEKNIEVWEHRRKGEPASDSERREQAT